jgi:hypothetical protein
MRFYLNGYAEMLHLVTTSRCLPPPAADRQSAWAAPGRPAGALRRLWRSLNALVRRRLSS